MTLPVEPENLPAIAKQRDVTPAEWRTLANVLYAGAAPESVGMVLDYCKARGLDPLKKPVHIMPMQVKDVKTGRYEWRDTVVPGIYEYRITAQRTGEYLGHSKPMYGPTITFNGLEAPEYCDLTVYRYNARADRSVEFPVTVYFSEACTLTNEGKPNARWKKAPRQMLTKCTEAAGLRAAFPEELGGEPTVDELGDIRVIESTVVAPSMLAKPEEPKPDGFDHWVADLQAVAEEGTERLQSTWKASQNALRIYLTRTNLGLWEKLKAAALEADIHE